MKKFSTIVWIGLMALFLANEAMATRGPMMHAYGTRATGLAGAFDAVSDDATSPTVYNPAGLTQIKDRRFDMEMIFLRTLQNFKSKNNNPQNGQNGYARSASASPPGFEPVDFLLLNNDSNNRTAKNNYFIMGGMGYAARISEKAVFGAGFVGRAGGGVFYHMKQSPFSFIVPYDANNTPSDRTDDALVPLLNTRRGTIVSEGTANIPISDSQLLTTPSDQAFFVRTEYSTDLKIPELGPAIGYEINDYFSVGVSARLVAGHFRFNQAVGTDATILKGTGIFNSGNPIRDTDTGEILTYGEVLTGQGVTGDLGNVQFGYPEVQGIGRLENSYSGGFGWGAGIHYRPYGSDKLVLSASYKSKAVMDFKGGDLTFDFSDQFRKFYYDTAQFGEFDTATFGASYLSNGAQSLRAPKFFNALLGTIDFPASQGNVLAQRAMEWFFNGTNKDGTPTLIRDARGYPTFINLTSIYDPYTKFALPRELAFGAAWRPMERLLLSLEYRAIYMNDMVGDYFTITLDSGTSPFFDWLIGVPQAGEFDFSMHTDFNTIHSVSLGAEYDTGDKWTIRGGVQHSNNTFTGDHVPVTFNMQPEDHISAGFSYRLTDNWELGFAGTFAFTFDTTESKGNEKSGDSAFVDLDGDGLFDQFVKGSKIDQFHSNAEFDHRQWQVNMGISYIW